ncbi:MAG: hypothetical protein NTY48_04930 [Candidatus Diapherotrites archaeon]|nr:hypothetical protein [Candidatus Diapherotrites archaeon]
MGRISYTRYGEERIPVVPTFVIDITSRCNFHCEYCIQKGRAKGPDMSIEDFNKIISQIYEYGRIHGIKPSICVAGGEPFLNKNAQKMIKFAVGILGRDSVNVTTNLSQFPLKKDMTSLLFEKCGRPGFNASIDREHLRFGKNVSEKLKAFFAAAKETHTSIDVINVATTPYERRYRWPKEIARLIPSDVKKIVKDNRGLGRSELTAIPRTKNRIRKDIEKWTKGDSPEMAMRTTFSLGIYPHLGGAHPGVSLAFAPDGKVYIHSEENFFYLPQLSIGNWRRESLHEIIKTNLPFKANMLREWFGGNRLNGRKKYGKMYMNEVLSSTPKKTIIANHVLKRFDELYGKQKPRVR